MATLYCKTKPQHTPRTSKCFLSLEIANPDDGDYSYWRSSRYWLFFCIIRQSSVNLVYTRSYLDLVNSHIKKKCDRSAATLETPKKMIHRGGGSQLTLSYNQPTNENRAISRAQDDRFCRSTINKISENHFCNWSRYETPLNRGLRARRKREYICILLPSLDVNWDWNYM